MAKIIDFIPKGSEKAVTLDHLSKVTGMGKRTVRQAISDVNMSGEDIICNGANHKGYYRPKNYEEAKAYKDYNVSYLVSFAEKTRAISRGIEKLFGHQEQMRLEDLL